jgi:MATE family multidrug resistance protein
VGRDDPPGARVAVKSALLAGAAFMSVTAVLFLTLPGPLTDLYTDEPEVVAVAVALIPIAGVFQVADGLQVVAAGVLRGVGDTTAPFVANLLAFWMVGLPIGIYLGFRTDAGPVGLWWGLVAGLALVALFLVLRVRVRMRRAIARVVIEDEAARPVDGPPPHRTGSQ